MGITDRSEALIDLLSALDDRGYRYVLVGGYAVSTFNTRFSTDLDVVVAPNDVDEWAAFLETRGFEQTDSHAKRWYYDTAVREYEKRLTPTQPIGVDLLVNGLGCRQTRAQWSYKYLRDHSHSRTISGGTVTTTARAVDGTVLVAAKLHSARETDLRDVLAIAPEIDLQDVTPHLHRGDEDALSERLERAREILDTEELRHGFRSDFGASTVSVETVSTLRRYLSERLEWMDN